MSILTRKLNQTVVYWGNPSQRGDGGFDFDDPVELDGRWEFKQEKFVDSIGEERISLSVVYFDQDVDIGGYLFLGELADLDSDEDPETQDGAQRIMQFLSTPNISNTESVRKVWL